MADIAFYSDKLFLKIISSKWTFCKWLQIIKIMPTSGYFWQSLEFLVKSKNWSAFFKKKKKFFKTVKRPFLLAVNEIIFCFLNFCLNLCIFFSYYVSFIVNLCIIIETLQKHCLINVFMKKQVFFLSLYLLCSVFL